MARKDYDQFADELIAAVGGKENIVSVTNCMTRLRFVLADESIVKDDEVKKIKGVMSVVHGAGKATYSRSTTSLTPSTMKTRSA